MSTSSNFFNLEKYYGRLETVSEGFRTLPRATNGTKRSIVLNAKDIIQTSVTTTLAKLYMASGGKLKYPKLINNPQNKVMEYVTGGGRGNGEDIHVIKIFPNH